MPSADQYLRQAQHNEALSTLLLGQSPVRYPDWAVTTAFYAALHYVNHYFMRTQGMVPWNHRARSSEIHRDAVLTGVRLEYQTLRDKCDEGRYNCLVATASEAQDLFDNQLQQVKNVAV